MCKYCKKRKTVGWEKQPRFQNTEEEYKDINKQRIWSKRSANNSVYAIIQNYNGITPKYEGKFNGRIIIRIPELDEKINIAINYCPFCGNKVGDVRATMF